MKLVPETPTDEMRSAFTLAWLNTQRVNVPIKFEAAYKAMLQSAPDALSEEAWKPIETARKNGRTVLLGLRLPSGQWRTMRGQWFSEEIIQSEWEDPEAPEGWYETSVECDDQNSCWPTTPSHWKPLPAPPTDRKDER